MSVNGVEISKPRQEVGKKLTLVWGWLKSQLMAKASEKSDSQGLKMLIFLSGCIPQISLVTSPSLRRQNNQIYKNSKILVPLSRQRLKAFSNWCGFQGISDRRMRLGWHGEMKICWKKLITLAEFFSNYGVIHFLTFIAASISLCMFP